MPAKPVAPVRFVAIPPVTVRAQLEAGPKFEPEVPDRDGARCLCGDGVSPRDRLTGLCRECFRVWRFSAGRQLEIPGDVVARKVG